MKIPVIFFVVVSITIGSCAHEQKKSEQYRVQEQDKQLATVTMQVSVEGMVCSACQATVKKTIKSLKGVKDAEVSLENKNAFITYYPILIQPEQILKAINEKGYAAGKRQERKQ